MTIPVPVEPLVGVLDRLEPGGGQPQSRLLAFGIEVVSRRVSLDDFAEAAGDSALNVVNASSIWARSISSIVR